MRHILLLFIAALALNVNACKEENYVPKQLVISNLPNGYQETAIEQVVQIEQQIIIRTQTSEIALSPHSNKSANKKSYYSNIAVVSTT